MLSEAGKYSQCVERDISRSNCFVAYELSAALAELLRQRDDFTTCRSRTETSNAPLSHGVLIPLMATNSSLLPVHFIPRKYGCKGFSISFTSFFFAYPRSGGLPV